jgi:hypothetical protein
MDGVTSTSGLYLPTSVCDEGLSEKLGIHRSYLRRLRAERIDLYDLNINGWLHGDTFADGTPVEGNAGPDPRSFLVRCLRGDDGTGIARAFLSDRYRMIDNIDVLMSALQGIEDAGVEVVIDGCDLSERRMYVRVVCPQVQVAAETLLRGYRNPFGEDFDRWREIADREGLGYGEGGEPIVFAGLVIQNSEVGDGAFSITPRAVVKVCKNGLVISKDMVRDVHLGGRLSEGVVDWSADTQQKAVELVRAKTRDSVSTFLSEGYLIDAVAKLEERAAEPVTSVDEVKVLVNRLKFSTEEIDGILSRFVQGGQMTRGGVMNAVTAQAQMVGDADLAHTMEEQATSLLV